MVDRGGRVGEEGEGIVESEEGEGMLGRGRGG